MIVLDASVMIAFLDRGDVHHEAAVALLTATVDELLSMNPLTLAEVLVGPVREGRGDAVHEALRELEVEEVPFPHHTARRLAEIRVATGLKMPDCCVLLTADAEEADVATFDARLAERAEGMGLRVRRG